MSHLISQLPLRLTLKYITHRDNFLFSNPQVKQALEQADFVYLWGNKSCGKTHLLLAMAEQIRHSVYLPLDELVNTASPAVFESLERVPLLCVDDLDAIAKQRAWQEALFHCFNRLQQTGARLLVSAHYSPVNIALTLPDLRSRMATALTYQLTPLTDDDKQRALQLHAQCRGLNLSDDVAAYLLRHYSRDMTQLVTLLSDLDKAAMSAKRRLTIPFIRKVLDENT